MRTTPERHEDRQKSELMKLTQVHKAGEFEAGIWIWGVTPEAALNLQCAVTTCIHLTNCHSFWIWGKWSISEVNSFLLSTYVYFAYSVPGSALSTGVMATNKTEVSEIIALWTDEKISPHRSPDIFVGTWVNYFHKSMSGVNTANLSCKNQCFNHWFSSSSWQEQHLIPVSDSLAEHKALISASGGTSKIVCVVTVCYGHKNLCTLLSIF